MNLSLTLGKRLTLFACISIVCFLAVQLLAGFVIAKWGITCTPAMRIVAVAQDVVMFITPAILTAMIVTRVPARLLAIDKRPPLAFTIIAICTLIVSVPAMNFIIFANESVHLPQSLHSLEQALKSMEESARQLVVTLQGQPTVPNLVMSILVVGVFAGLGEELFFRGTFMRLLTTGRVNPHIAIWTVAVVFSILHMQFYGFLPRTLLGAYFGYLLLWSRSLWVPVIAHVFNNSLYVWSQWSAAASGHASVADTIGYDGNTVVVLGSAAFTTACIMLLRTQRKDIKSAK